MNENRVQFISHRGRDILFLNFSGCGVNEVLSTIDDAAKVIRVQPEGSVRTLTDVTNARFDDRVSEQMKKFTAHNKPYVRAAAVVGITGIKKIIFEAVMLFSKRKIHSFDTLDQAKDWLAMN